MKKFRLFAVSALILCLFACNSQQVPTNDDDIKTIYRVEIIKQLDHASLNEISDAIVAELQKLDDANDDILIDIFVDSGQNDSTVLKQIADQAIADNADVIIPIATLAAQISTVAAEETGTPVIFAAISDPEGADLTGIDYVSGTSDALNTEFIFRMMQTQNPDLKKVGLLYSLSETNSTKPVSDMKALLDAAGIEYVEAVGNTNDEVLSSASVLIAENVEAIFTPTDNVVMAAEMAIAPLFAEAGIPHYTGADSFVRNGAFTTCGVNYTDLGTQTADLAYRVMMGGIDGEKDYYLVDGGIITVNSETAEALNIDPQIFASMGEVIEVTTTED